MYRSGAKSISPSVYKGERVSCHYRADFVFFEDIIAELKALASSSGAEKARVQNYLTATGFHRGLPPHFGTPVLTVERLVNGRPPPSRL